MAANDAKRFLEEFRPGTELEEAVRAIQREDGETLMSFYARAAAKRGFDFTAEELKAAYSELQEADRAAMEAAELSDSELDQMGASGAGCWFSQFCSKVIQYDQENENCKYSFQPGENCSMLDECNKSLNTYSCTEGPGYNIKS